MSAAPAESLPRVIPAPAIIESVALQLGLHVEDLRGLRVSHSLRFARCIAALLLADYTLFSRAEIGRALGATDRQHTYSRALKLLGDDERFRAALEQCRERVLQWDRGGHDR
jgi:chromosomal replication initiation ATPase DnaA